MNIRSRIDLGVLIFELTPDCNQNCRFCYNYWRVGFSPLPGPDFAQARRTLKELYRQARVSSVSFSGGEPMLMPRIHDLVLLARRRGSHVNILTNGTLLSGEDIGIFTDLGVSNLQIPLLSADSQVHDSLTQVPGSWKKAVTAARMAAAQKGGPVPNAVLVLTAANSADIEATFALYRDLGISHVMVNRFNLGGQGLRHRSELELSHVQLRDAFSRVDACARHYCIENVHSGVCTPMCILNPADYPSIRFSFCSTDLRSRPIALTHTGDVRFCNHSPFTLGNIFKDGIADILGSSSASGRYSAVPDKCSGCPHLRICGGGCRAASEQVYGTFAHADPILDAD